MILKQLSKFDDELAFFKSKFNFESDFSNSDILIKYHSQLFEIIKATFLDDVKIVDISTIVDIILNDKSILNKIYTAKTRADIKKAIFSRT